MADGELDAKLAEAERQLVTLRDIRDTLGSRIAPAREYAARARDKVAAAAQALVLEGVDLPKLLAEAETAAAHILDIRAKLMALAMIAPHGGEASANINAFMSRAWLQDELGDAWKHRTSAAEILEALAALQHDANAPLLTKVSAQ